MAQLARHATGNALFETTSSRPWLGAGFGGEPRQLNAADFGKTLPSRPPPNSSNPNNRRKAVLLDTLSKLDKASPTASYHQLAAENVERWAQERAASVGATDATTDAVCSVRVLPGDWGEVTHAMTKEYGTTFASLNMANAFNPGGGYERGCVAQEENMFRRTDCHYSLERSTDMTRSERYTKPHTALLNAAGGRVYLDTAHPRVCIRGPEDRTRADLGYELLAAEELFPFYELRAAAVDLRDPRLSYDHAETVRRAGAMLDTVIEGGLRHVVLSAFGCGAFQNPAHHVACAFREALTQDHDSSEGPPVARARCLDVVCFAIFDAGYGPDNFTPFKAQLGSWESDHGLGDDASAGGACTAASDEGGEGVAVGGAAARETRQNG